MTPTEDSDATEPDATQADEDPRLMAAMREYMAALDAGKRVNRRELVARHPDIAAELSACLQGLSFIHGAAGELTDGGASPRNGAMPTPGPPPPEPLNATPLGDYRLLREIGRGGMGVVYEATQLSLGRQVAVKVLPMAAALDPKRLQRFRNEAQAAAGLHHTNIVPVYAVGCDRSTHFYAMQLIEGRSLAEVIREMRAAESAGRAGRRSAVARRLLEQPDSGTVATPNTVVDDTQVLHRPAPVTGPSSAASGVAPSSAWSGPRPADSLSTMHVGRRSEYFRIVARLGVQAAEALDYAHGLGIIHRDIKPANLMVDGRGNLWVTDFGLAQMYGDNGLTQTGDFVGTFRYMSPEQAGGGPGRLGLGRRHKPVDDTEDGSDSGAPPVVLDPRTDVYSLGVTLYELLTLQPALPGRSREDLMYQLASVDPRPPRSIDRAIPPELQTIVLKASAKDPADRYATARALADDLKRYLADEPIHARPPTVWDHAVKWTRRHKSLALSAIVILTLAAAGLGASTLIVAAEQSRTRTAYDLSSQREAEARRQEAEARRQKELAEAAYRQARSAVDDLARVAADDLPNNQQTAAVRKLMLQKALSYYQQFVSTRSGTAAAAADPYLLQAQQRATAMLGELVATDNGYRVRFDIRLLNRASVQAALNLDPNQVDAAQDLADRAGGPGGPGPDGGGGPPDVARPVDTPDTVERLQKSLASLLRPAQVDRLKQISRQLRGVRAFDDPEVQAQLDLTPEQTEAVRKIRASAGGGPPHGGPDDRPLDGPFGSHDGDDGGGFRGGHGKWHVFGPPGSAAAVQRVIDQVLTTRQKAAWTTLTGVPFADGAPAFARHPHGEDDGPPMD